MSEEERRRREEEGEERGEEKSPVEVLEEAAESLEGAAEEPRLEPQPRRLQFNRKYADAFMRLMEWLESVDPELAAMMLEDARAQGAERVLYNALRMYYSVVMAASRGWRAEDLLACFAITDIVENMLLRKMAKQAVIRSTELASVAPLFEIMQNVLGFYTQIYQSAEETAVRSERVKLEREKVRLAMRLLRRLDELWISNNPLINFMKSVQESLGLNPWAPPWSPLQARHVSGEAAAQAARMIAERMPRLDPRKVREAARRVRLRGRR